ncbi:MAG: ABC transporter substrate-binding protein [Trueperaceae bacterium]
MNDSPVSVCAMFSRRTLQVALSLSVCVAALLGTSLAAAPQAVVDYANEVGPHPADARIANVGTPTFGGTLNVAENELIPSIDSHRSSARTTTIVNSVFAEGLFAFNAVGGSHPALVDTYDVSEDGLVYTFTLRPGVKFHDGSDLRSSDVVASLNRWQGGTLGRQAAENISTLEAVDDLTVRINLSAPHPFLIYQLTVPQTSGAYIYPAAQVEANPDLDIEVPIGTGPYFISERREGQFTAFDRFDDYVGRVEAPSGFAGGQVAYVDRIVLHEIPDAAVRAAGVESGQFHMIRQATPDLYRIYENHPTVRPNVQTGSFASANFNKCQGIMTDIRLRLAVRKAIDVRQVVAAVGPAEFNVATSSFAPPGDPWDTPIGDEAYFGYDPEGARELMAEAGYTNQPIRWLVDPNVPSYYTAALVSKPMLEEVGFNVEIMPMDAATLRTMRNDPTRYELYAQSLAWRPDPAALTHLSDGNPGCWVTDEKNRILDALRAETDFDVRYQLWEELTEQYYEDVAGVKFESYGTLDLEAKVYSGSFSAWAYYNFINTWLND